MPKYVAATLILVSGFCNEAPGLEPLPAPLIAGFTLYKLSRFSVPGDGLAFLDFEDGRIIVLLILLGGSSVPNYPVG